MNHGIPTEIEEILDERFRCDSLLALATVCEGKPYVRPVNAFYEDGAFYIITNARSEKLKHMARDPQAAVCGEWFTGHGTGENLGHVCSEENEDMAGKLRAVFQEWYHNGHVDEKDPDTCILKIRLTDGVLFKQGKRYEFTCG